MALVSRIIGDCPGCGGKNTFGNVSIHRNRLNRGCTRCRHRVHWPLTEMRKKIIYLDQSFFSRAFRQNDAKFVQVAQRIAEIAHRQAIVIPYSSIHEDETHLWRGADGKTNTELMHFIKSTTGNHEFKPAYSVEKDQLVKGFIRFIQGEPPAAIDESDALPDDIHDWNNYIWIDVGGYLGSPEKVRRSKEQSSQQLLALFERWRKVKPNFDADVEFELRDAAAIYIQLYQEYLKLLADGDFSTALFETTVRSSIVETMVMHCFDRDIPMYERLEKVSAYFQSEHYKHAPYQWVSARMFALLKERVWSNPPTNKEKTAKRYRSFFHDVDHIATYAPYCDAFFMDNAMADMMRDPRIALEQRYGVKVFSINNWSAFLDWLEDVDKSLSADHLTDLGLAYPPSIVDPMEALRRSAQERHGED